MQAGFTASCSGISKLAADLPSVNIDSSNAHALCGTAEAFLRLAHFAFFSDGVRMHADEDSWVAVATG